MLVVMHMDRQLGVTTAAFIVISVLMCKHIEYRQVVFSVLCCG
jgi:hypothetical protein